MSGETYDHLSKPNQLLANVDEERLLRIVNSTKTVKLFDYVSNLLVVREAERGDSDSTDVLLDYLVEKRNRVLEVETLNRQFEALTLDEEEIAFQESINEALFKDFDKE